MTTQSATGPLVIYKPEGADVRKTYFLTTTAGYLHSSLDAINHAFNTSSGHDHDGTDSKQISSTAVGMTWSSWTPGLIANSSFTAQTINMARYSVVGKQVFVRGSITFSASLTGAGTIDIGGWPAAFDNVTTQAWGCVGNYLYYDLSGTTFVSGALSPLNVNQIRAQGASGITITTGDVLSWSATWEIA